MCVRLGVSGLGVGWVVLEVDSLKKIEPSWLYRKNVAPACNMVSLWLWWGFCHGSVVSCDVMDVIGDKIRGGDCGDG